MPIYPETKKKTLTKNLRKRQADILHLEEKKSRYETAIRGKNVRNGGTRHQLIGTLINWGFGERISNNSKQTKRTDGVGRRLRCRGNRTR